MIGDGLPNTKAVDTGRMVEHATLIIVRNTDGRLIKFMRRRTQEPPKLNPQGVTIFAYAWVVLTEPGVWLRKRNQREACEFDSFQAAYLAAQSCRLVPALD